MHRRGVRRGTRYHLRPGARIHDRDFGTPNMHRHRLLAASLTIEAVSYRERPANPSPPRPGVLDEGRARVVIVGGGYTGAAVAVQLANAVGERIAITIVEPREEVGCGMAYSTRDPDHRLNGPLDNHLLDPARADGLREWCAREGVLTADRDAQAANGGTYVRRGDFGRFVASAVREAAARPGTSLRHHRAMALGVECAGKVTHVIASDGTRFPADMMLIATGNGTPRLPALFSRFAGDSRVIVNPFDAEALGRLRAASRILLVGSGLTAMDVTATLLRHGKRHRIDALSRHGLRPATHRERVPDLSPLTLLERIEGPVPEYALHALGARSMRALSRALRERIAGSVHAGADWREAFDELRNVVWQVWPRVPAAEKRRFLRHLRIHYDTYRFRVPPQTRARVESAERNGEVGFHAGRLVGIAANGDALRFDCPARAGAHDSSHDYDAIVNCTGLEADCGARSNPFLASLLAAGLLRHDDCGFGFAVDAQCRPIGRDGEVSSNMRLVGPPSAGTHGDPLGVIFIAAQVRRVLPGVVAALGLSTAKREAAAN